MAEEKPGLLKRIFSFGFGKKKQAEETVADNSAELELAREQEAIDAASLAQEQMAADEAARLEAARLEAAELEVEIAAADRAAAKKAEAERAAAEKAAKEQVDADKKAEQASKKAEEAATKKALEANRKLEEQQNAAAAKAEATRMRKELQQTEKLQAEKLQTEKLLAEKVRAEILEAEKLAKEKQEEKAAADRLAVQAKEREQAKARKIEADKLAAIKIAEEREAAKQVLTDEDELEFSNETTHSQETIDGSSSSGKTNPLIIEDSVLSLTERKARKVEAPEPELDEDRKSGWLARLTKGLSRSSTSLKENITQVFVNRKLDDETLQDLEDVLIQADLGIETAMKITDTLSAQKFGKMVSDEEVREVMAAEIEKILDPVAMDLDLDLNHQPHVILIVGVNGSGKTTTIGKLSQKLYDAGFSTSLVAGDTFRAAAIEQLKIWGERTQSPVLYRPLGSDAAGLAYDAWTEAKEERRDVLLIDTAGRLQNKTELMNELEKIVRVLRKQDPTAPHTVLLTLDATTGQNALNQVEIFKQVAGVNGLVMTKLDGTARGGILVAISAKHKLPIYFVGVGEQVADLEPFEARDFARSIAGLPKEND